MTNEHVIEVAKIAAIVVFKTVVATTTAHYLKKYLVDRDRKNATKQKAADAA